MNLKNALLVSILMAGASGVASAQSATNWTGLYLGANAGYGFGKSDVTSTITYTGYYYPSAALSNAVNASGADSVKPKGFTGGITFGYNAQNGNMVYGFEMDANTFSAKGDRSATGTYPGYPGLTYTVNQTTKATYLATFRGRIGYATGRSLWFGTAGLAMTSIKIEDSFSDNVAPATESASASKSKAGWTIGGGYELDMQNNWSFKAELLYVNFGKVTVDGGPFTVAGTPSANNPVTHTADLKAEVIRVGFNYRF